MASASSQIPKTDQRLAYASGASESGYNVKGGPPKEVLPEKYNYTPLPVGVPAVSIRSTITPRTGPTFNPGDTIEILISASPGVHLDPSQTYLQFLLTNSSAATSTFTLDHSAFACFDQVDVLFGSQVISSIQNYNSWATTVFDMQCSGDDRKHAFTTYGAANDTTSLSTYEGRSGSAIQVVTASTPVSAMFCLPLLNFLGTMALKSIPVGQLGDGILLRMKLAAATEWGVSTAGTPVMSMSGVRLQTGFVQLDGSVERSLVQSLGGRISVPCYDVRSFRTTLAAAQNSIS